MRCVIAVVMILCAGAQLRGDDILKRKDDILKRKFPFFHIGGFADLEVHTTSENEREGLDVIGVDFYSTLQLSNSWTFLAEPVVERKWRRAEGRHIDVSLERFYIEYSRSDAFRVEIGQTQTGIIRWNEREHQSRFLQTPIDVPGIARRPQDDGAWPQRFIGVFASGRVPGPLGIGWGFGLGGGPGRLRDRIPIFGSDRSPAGLVSLSMAPDALPGLEVGVTAYAQHVRTEPERIRERDVTLSLSYVSSGTEVRAEWARMNHRLTTSGLTYRTTGYYALLSKRLSAPLERLRPYVMLDHVNVANNEAYLAEATDENAWAGGVRYDLTQRLTIKGEYRSQRAPNGHRETVFGAQFGFSF